MYYEGENSNYKDEFSDCKRVPCGRSGCPLIGCNQCECKDWYNAHLGPEKGYHKTRFCDPPYPYIDSNVVKDYKMLENHPDPGQVTLRQNISTKHVRIENSSYSDVLVGIDITRDPHHAPKPKFMLYGGQVKDLAVNMPGERLQFIWLFDPKTGKPINDPHPMRYQTNLFVVIEGLNRWWVMDFQHKGYRGQF